MCPDVVVLVDRLRGVLAVLRNDGQRSTRYHWHVAHRRQRLGQRRRRNTHRLCPRTGPQMHRADVASFRMRATVHHESVVVRVVGVQVARVASLKHQSRLGSRRLIK